MNLICQTNGYHVQIQKLQSNELNVMIDVVKNDTNKVDFLLELEVNLQLNIIKENLLIDIIQDCLFNLKKYIS